MATYTSAGSGPWDAGTFDTWGGGIGVYPNLASDVVNIQAGHTVEYNVESTAIMGRVTVAGTLSFSRSMDTRLTLNATVAAQLFVSDGGTLDVGTVVSPIPAAYTATIACDVSAMPVNINMAGRYRPQQGIVVARGGFFSMVGDEGHYGAKSADLVTDWTSGQVLTVAGDVSGWAIGGTIVVTHPYMGETYRSTYEEFAWSHTRLFTIAGTEVSGGNTLVTVAEAFP